MRVLQSRSVVAHCAWKLMPLKINRGFFYLFLPIAICSSIHRFPVALLSFHHFSSGIHVHCSQFFRIYVCKFLFCFSFALFLGAINSAKMSWTWTTFIAFVVDVITCETLLSPKIMEYLAKLLILLTKNHTLQCYFFIYNWRHVYVREQNMTRTEHRWAAQSNKKKTMRKNKSHW